MKTSIPYDIDPGWNPESGEIPTLFCSGCGAEVTDSDGFNTQHEVLDCLAELHRRLTQLEGANRNLTGL